MERVYYTKYYETILRIPAECKLTELEVHYATQLQMITVSGSNLHLKVLVITKAAMRRIPRPLENLQALTHFVATDGQLEVVNLEAFHNVMKLKSVTLAANKVRVLEISTDAELYVATQDLILSDNELEYIDMEFFVPLKRLIFVDLHNNRLKQIVVREGKLITLPTITTITLSENRLKELNVTGWGAPKLSSIDLESNNLTRLPIGLDRLDGLQILQMGNNQLTTVDLGRFARCREMVRIDLSNNMLRTILPTPHIPHTTPSRVSLPNLRILVLSNNNLNNINYELWNFPKLATLLLSMNRIQRVPSLSNLLPGLQRALLTENPILCSNLRSLEADIASFKLRKGSITYI
ncbi:leucine-rich repeat transmembrane neuronal protein 2-like [Anopheles darlingi]|uniref:leucine-rich repeat transmembrane neuronal protein 2-like n=1 Tax=Anopheles darlingi TaxID=43151 RepID=UPI0021000B6F|nr:leucine-rich repeat transmembrane neuronal protein 2-like [Anopheles darlingi]